MKRLLTNLLCLMLAFILLLPAEALAAAPAVVDSGACGAQGGNLTWVLTSDGVLTISGTGNMADYPRLPKSSISSVVINEGVTSIGDGTFYGCSGLASATIPSSVTSIGDSAFFGCSSLTSAAIPEGVTSIGLWTFGSCRSLESVTIPSSVTSIGNMAFSDCSELGSVTIPEGVTSIGGSAFGHCSSLTSVTIPSSMASIGDGAFSGCSILASVTIPEGVTSIGSGTFAYCSSLESVTIPEGVTSIGDRAFAYCDSLENVTIPESVTSIGNYAFSNCGSLTDVHYSGTAEQWKRVRIGTNNEDLTGATVNCTFVPKPLRMITQPKSAAANVGGTVRFTAAVSGNGVKYQWQFSENGGEKWYNSPAEGNRTAILTVPATQDRNGFMYRCKVTDSHGSTLISDAAALTVTNPAVFAITAQPENVTATVGDTVHFTVTAIGEGLEYQWKFSDDGGTKWHNSPAEGNNTATLTVPATRGRNGNKYRCKVTDSKGRKLISDAAALTVTEAAAFAIIGQPGNVMANVGGTVRFTAAVSGNGVKYQWQFSENGGEKWYNSPAEGNRTAILTVPATQDRNGFMYRCKVTDSHGSTLISDAAALTVTNPAVFAITAQPGNVMATVGDTVHFTVTATGDGLAYQWQFSENGGEKWYNSPAAGNRTATLTVPATQDRNGFMYRCRVTDSHGSRLTSASAVLTVIP